jgi:hypothetical protein
VVDAEIMDGLTSAFPGAEIRTGTEWTLTDAPYRVVVGGPEGTNPTDLVTVIRQVYQAVDTVLVKVAVGRDQDIPSNPMQEHEPHA